MNPLLVPSALNSQSTPGVESPAPAILPSMEPGAAPSTRRIVPLVPTACLICRRRHLKCDGQRPCSRCKTVNLDCVYVSSRRGYNGRQRTATRSPSQPAAVENPVDVAALAATTVGPAPPVPALELPSIFDPSTFAGIVPNYSGVSTSFPTVTFSQTTASTTLPIFSFQSPLGGIGEPGLGFGVEVPRALPLRERYLDSFYRNFFAAHPFIPPKEVLLVLAQGTSLGPLFAAIRWIGSLYIKQDTSDSLLKDACRLIDGNPLKDGFLVQARLLLIIGLDGNRQRKRAERLMAEARDMSIQINLNTDRFATTNGQGILILEESWRRTWWELYVVDALMSGVHQTDTFALYRVPTDVALPCEEYQYLTGQIPPPMHPYDMENIGLFDGRPFSSYTYRIQCACFLGTLQRMPTQVEHIDKLLANWMLRLPPSKYDAYCKGELDEMLFQAIMMWHAISILLHQPHSQLDPSSTHYIKACAPNTPAISSDAFNPHTKRTIQAARELSKMVTYRVPLLKHTHFFAYMVTLSSTIHLSKWSLAFVAQDDEDLRQDMRQSIGALVKYAEMWPMAQHLGRQVKQIAKEVYMMKKREQQQPPE
ncbi:related to Zn(II)2Cys6 transcriptional activator [Fusarium torulosum]|uniref:Related to Zn(II)2Cys6 transcriptional activator n=1 Tax=Fusarium torulosum TaxID=33205 RepID=A0AAE8M6B8_9HYPO|nr:related to Zn(II)2Cys6 transcriptional activator [Fusarium torulosum]